MMSSFITISVSNLLAVSYNDFELYIREVSNECGNYYCKDLQDLLDRGWWNPGINRYCHMPPSFTDASSVRISWHAYLKEVSCFNQDAMWDLIQSRLDIYWVTKE